jgi:hypothetical protein
VSGSSIKDVGNLEGERSKTLAMYRWIEVKKADIGEMGVRKF